MTLIERTEQFERDAHEFKRLKEAEHDAGTFNTREGKIAAQVDTLRPLLNAFHLFRRHAIPLNVEAECEGDAVCGLPPTDAQWAARLHALLAQLQQAYAKDPRSVAKRAELWSILGEMSRFRERLKAALQASWRKYTDECVGRLGISVDESTLVELARVPALAASIHHIRQLQSRVKQCALQLPRADGDLQRFQEAARELAVEWSRMSGGGIPEDVLQLLREAGSTQGAPLALLTDDVQAWLEEKGIASSFSIIIRRSHHVGPTQSA